MMNEQTTARRLLDYRTRGYSIRLHMREMRSMYIASLASGAFGIGLLYAAELDIPMWIAVGTGIGLLLRDMMWFQAAKGFWPFSEKVTDWNKVQAMAWSDGRSPEDGTSPDAVR